MLERGGMVGFDEHHSTIDWKSPVRKSSEKTLSKVIWREVMRERHVKFLGLVNESALRTLSGGIGRALFSSTLARAFSRGSLLSIPTEKVSLRCFMLDLNK